MGTPLRVLILEDNPADAELALHALRRAGYVPQSERVETEADFRAQLLLAPEVILADFSMPEFDALAALEIMQTQRLDIPFIIVSGTIGEERAVEVMHRGATDYVIKDRLARLGPAIEQALARRILKKDKLKAEDSVARLAAIVESSGEAIIAKTLTGVITSWNHAAQVLFGYQAHEVIGKNIAILLPHGRRRSDAPEDAADILRRLSAGEAVAPFETVRVRSDQRRIEVLLSISPIHDAIGVLMGTSVITHDITPKKRSERHLQAEQAVSAILAESGSLDEAGPRVLRTIAECLRWEVAVLWTIDHDAHVLRRRLLWHSDWADSTFIGALNQQETLAPGNGVAGRTWSTGEPVWESGIVLDNATTEFSATTREGLRGAFGLPMRQGAEMVGVIEFYNPELREPDKALIASLENIANQISQFCERRRTEISLRASEERYRTLIAATTAIVWDTPASGEFETEQLGWTAFTGQTFSELRGWGWLKCVHRDDREHTAQVWTTAWKARTVYQVEHRLRRRDGEYRMMSVRGVPVMDSGGAIREWVGVHTDVTEQKHAERELHLRDRAIQAATQGLLITDPAQPDNPIVYASPGFERITGYHSKEALGRNCRFLQGKETDPRASAQIHEAIQAEQSCTVELLNYRKDGTSFWNELSISPVRDEAGQLTHFVGVQSDVTDRRRMEDQFRQSQKMEVVGQLAGGVAHDFNNLLTIISGYGELLLGMLPGKDSKREAVEAICEAGQRAAGLTGQLLSFSRRAVLEMVVLDLNEVARETQRMLRRMIGEDILLSAVLDPTISRVKVDPGQIGQVLMNLAINARDAMPQGGKLTIETSEVELDEDYASQHADCKAGRYVQLAVSDNGCGMTPDVKAHIFEPFFSTKGPGKGTGLGLATVYGIVKQCGGTINLYSEPGIGTNFKIYFPAVDEPAQHSILRQGGAKVSGGAETILLVEDEDAVRAIARIALQGQGYTVLHAENGRKALALVERTPGDIDLLVTDVVMPGMNGRELAEDMLRAYPTLKVLYVSGYTDDSVIRHGILQVEVAFLQKPYTPLSLARKVRDVLDKK